MLWWPTISERGISRKLRVGTVMGLQPPTIAISNIAGRAISRLRPVITTRLRDRSSGPRRLHHDRVFGPWICPVAHSYGYPRKVRWQSKTTQFFMTYRVGIFYITSGNEILYSNNVEWSFDNIATTMSTTIFLDFYQKLRETWIELRSHALLYVVVCCIDGSPALFCSRWWTFWSLWLSFCG